MIDWLLYGKIILGIVLLVVGLFIWVVPIYAGLPKSEGCWELGWKWTTVSCIVPLTISPLCWVIAEAVFGRR